MGRKGWRVARAFRVLLACLALWLPARSASPWVAPADAVVMVAGTTPVVSVESAASDANAPSTLRRAAQSSRGALLTSSPLERGEPGARRERATTRPRTAPLYLLHCVLLR